MSNTYAGNLTTASDSRAAATRVRLNGGPAANNRLYQSEKPGEMPVFRQMYGANLAPIASFLIERFDHYAGVLDERTEPSGSPSPLAPAGRSWANQADESYKPTWDTYSYNSAIAAE